jgi:hypothetical protein
MKKINYPLAIILIVFWVIGFFKHLGGASIHLLLIGSLALIFINVISSDKSNSAEKNINNQ